ncbi:MAG: DNA repair protein RecO [Fuerstiella sp.]|nr:DNA repair protein RecO [Fuerstiella sp.]MDG2131521.1 DNA repair protein RecO [Fuerstiella sp.]
MSTEKAEAIVIRQADFSESSRVVTFFSKEFGKFSALAKGAKRLKGPFDAALDLLSMCRIVFIRKSSGTLSLLTQASLDSRFSPVSGSLNSLYGGYYIADLLCSLTEDEDPDPEVYRLAHAALKELSDPQAEPAASIIQFEIGLLRQAGLFPNLSECGVCGQLMTSGKKYAHWVSQGGLLCSDCRREEYSGKSISAGSVAVLKRMSGEGSQLSERIRLTKDQTMECHRLAVSVITNVLGRKPGTLRYLNF